MVHFQNWNKNKCGLNPHLSEVISITTINSFSKTKFAFAPNMCYNKAKNKVLYLFEIGKFSKEVKSYGN
jgi:hypothetical protein